MTKFPERIYLKESKKEREILTFGKDKELYDKDSKNGVSRFGGFLRGPSYTHAYLKAAQVVLDEARKKEELDELGLPIFYLIRHSAELKIKGLLEMAYEIFEMRKKCYPDKYAADKLPSRGQLARLKESHDLTKIYGDLSKSCKLLNINIPEKNFSALLNLIDKYETNPTWSRYASSKFGNHVVDEIELPILKLARLAEELFEEIAFEQKDLSESLERELYSVFTSLFALMEEKI